MSGHRQRRLPELSALLLLPFFVALLALLAACGGGGGGGGGSTPTNPPPPTASVTFTPASAGGAGAIYLAQGADSTTTKLVLELRSGGVPNLYGVAFDLQYPANLLQLTQVTQGPLLADGTFQENMATSGKIVVGVTRLGTLPGVSDPGVLVRFEFRPLITGSGQLAFSRNAALDSSGAPIASVSWVAGSVTSVIP
ncbi:MAG TPA: cohesin domain-containing protein [Thermoanaerobaculia bacterium]|nr:cohesin domain-containing protein [Thermoanaerobaculia bacterium]